MNYFCRHCHNPLKNGQQMCSCGQIFAHPVPEKDDVVGVVYWEIPSASSTESKVQRIHEIWNGVNPAAKAGGFGALAVLLIVFVLAGSHRTAPVTQPQIAVAPIVRPTAPAQAPIQPQTPSGQTQVPSAQPPLVLEPLRPPSDATTSSQNSTGQSSNGLQQQYQQAEKDCELADIDTILDMKPDDAQAAISSAENLDNQANFIENKIQSLAPERQGYWTQEVAKIRRKAEARREEAQALPQRHQFGSP